MRKCLLFWLLTGLSLPSRAQLQVILLPDTTRFQLSQSALDKEYASITTLIRVNPAALHTAMRRHFTEFDLFVKKQANIPRKAFGLFVHEYYRPTGQARYVLVAPDTPQPDSVMANVLKVLTEFYSTTPYPASGSVPFRSMSGMMFGKAIVPERMARRGPGVINTLEAARSTTRPDTVKKLGFNQLDLLDIPDVVYRFPNLEELDLSRNRIHTLPARLTADIPSLKRLSLLGNIIPDDSVFITRNTHLRALNLQSNRITRIPPAIRHNRHLESLWLGNNKLAALDMKTLRRLHRLNDLNLYNTGLTVIPAAIRRLRHVVVLDLYYNKLRELPRQIGRMKRLEQLAVAHNDLTQLPASLAKLRYLHTLYAHHNRIGQLPANFSTLKELRVLDISYNWFSVAPSLLASLPALEELALNNNNLQELPADLNRLKNLKKLHLRSNPLTQGDAKTGPYARLIEQLEANKTEVFY